MAQRICSIDGCSQSAHARGWCRMHYERWKRRGNPLLRRRTFEERFWAKINRNGSIPTSRPDFGPCWEWTDSLTSYGYGRLSLPGTARMVMAHRVAYELLVGSIPDGFEVDHLCFNRACVNPAHLEAVTPQINTLRNRGPSAVNAHKTHCVNGHSLSGENSYIATTGQRKCRACERAAEARYRARKKTN